MQHTLLIVEDEHQLRSITADYLRNEGYRVLEAADGEEALALSLRDTVSLYILDWMLPGIDGKGLCRRIREISPAPILFLTAKSEELDKLTALELGADDYMTKPFSIRELAVRVKVLIRRAFEMNGRSSGMPTWMAENPVLERGRMLMDPEKHQVYIDQVPVELTSTEFKILLVLSRVPGRVYSRMQLLEQAMGVEYAGYERTIDTHIRNVRKKIERNADQPEMILTVFGVGYKFEVAL
ncbi:response regulator transcription factor [Paenibacillus sp. N3/727]|uniref:response regulator transcription factor n=1 Tax=Paenibacillus sp. N3/727 TaxID=2925845 RepID=UPI001F53DD9E|nr:response regulator transcription factor [Paenibacillus sp. N3/727]UNK19201.1 response regulator transcription factor [Paenibacillus sp. N3/727]